jgi:hypothetical protein
MVRKPANQRIVNSVPDPGQEQDATGKSRIHASDVREKDELKKDDRASRHRGSQLARAVGQALEIPELRRVSPHRSSSGIRWVAARISAVTIALQENV